MLNGKEYHLALNDGENHLHGGIRGFDRVVWKAKEIRQSDGVGVELTYLAKDGEEGYPGNLTTTVRYFLNNQNELVINYHATTDQPTVINLTQHSYFNLKGEGCGDILEHEIMINAPFYTAVDEGLIPTGELKPVKNTPLDFLTRQPIGTRIKETNVPGGYDHNYVLKREGAQPSLAAKVLEPQSGRVLVLHHRTGLRFYTGNSLKTFINKGEKYPCIMVLPQHISSQWIPSTILILGVMQTTIFN